ncbi:hypothetical protein H2200_007900 [Cladophialophora chaetospira]|uniref:Heterokaryon incompatibility domain-containing protein n=1 Tax=Cladophialophora chaetospira TaxID=386627 RepID=A0AA38X6Q9_9EURO|nr:hypothetical protein H2200_007900 [Cladophialophora chaetospira]
MTAGQNGAEGGLNGAVTLLLEGDAVCIDQSAVEEKNHQVHMMHEICSAARQVIVWLGQSSPLTDRLFETSVEGKGLEYDQHKYPYLGDLDADDLEGILENIRKPYWSRIWIVQELVRAREVVLMCGTKQLNFEELKRLAGSNADDRDLFYDPIFRSDILAKKAAYPYWRSSDLDRWQFIHEMFWDHHAGGTTSLSRRLSDLIFSFGHMNCHDAHDRVYALFGLLDQSTRALVDQYLGVDYSRSMINLLNLTLECCERNNEDLGTSAVLDLIIIMRLRHYCLEMESSARFTSSEPFLGPIDPIAAQELTKTALQTPLAKETLGLLGVCGVDNWIHSKGLRWHKTTIGEKVLIDSSVLEPGDLMYRFSPIMNSLSSELRPADCDELVIAVRLGEAHQARVVTVGIIPEPATTPAGSLFDDGPYDAATARLLRWRELIGVFLRDPQVELSVFGQTLEISSTLNHWIALSDQLLEEASMWDSEKEISRRSLKLVRTRVLEKSTIAVV